jgi:hypothetical protein
VSFLTKTCNLCGNIMSRYQPISSALGSLIIPDEFPIDREPELQYTICNIETKI